jgi:hypothetical protein
MAGAEPDTAFAVLMLTRSTQRALRGKIETLGEGLLVGGRGLPASGELEMRLGQVRAKPLTGPADQILSVLEDRRNPEQLRALESLERMANNPRQPDLPELQQRLRQLAGNDSPAARGAAIKALSRTRNLDNAPLMIEALSDADVSVVEAADDGLRYMSRKLSGFTGTTDLGEVDRQKLIASWKRWYLSVRPDAELPN